MDGYIAKPVDAPQLRHVIAQVMGTVAVLTTDSEGDKPDSVFNRGQLLERLEGDEKLLGQLVEVFKRDTPICIEQLSAAVGSGQFDQVKRHAHELKGMAVNMSAARLSQSTDQLEKSADAADTDALEQAFKQLEGAVDELMSRLK